MKKYLRWGAVLGAGAAALATMSWAFGLDAVQAGIIWGD